MKDPIPEQMAAPMASPYFTIPMRTNKEHPQVNPRYRGIGYQVSAYDANIRGSQTVEPLYHCEDTVAAQKSTNIALGLEVEHMLSCNNSMDGQQILMYSGHGIATDRHGSAAQKIMKHSLRSQGAMRCEPGLKPRGRPRVIAEDKTAADRRRTQIRVAQRAYRERKEKTILFLKKRTQELRRLQEATRTISINLYEFAIRQNLSQREPEFCRELRSSIESILALTEASTDDAIGCEENHAHEREPNYPEPELQAYNEATNRQTCWGQGKEDTPPASDPGNLWGLFTQSNSQKKEIQMGSTYQIYDSCIC
ncbi:hypothetical protein OIDMADRAFT_184511 [Oidiodendron maius Zn]|uniref:BZIP domain-containing protein n=1 Tax=Oidiodendron maius (strain Zn) TaxID=913774 RepID=A0A0C3GUG6_OIDMZ|nr:hypothetical protein OIDMADRAFT_184511 [Oidiodendron maius Zn]